ncbi:unnamed protein product [Notodromas monacha]|uniref:DUF229 domain containing protein n=1 Tax=Notodromas monacha TaxID=399045 RepID=A0A7R9BCL5_9CRUS|nr:unnamed protein product [Notodromas monacha]CAG0912203.1 unnamed protein product [Notodromas monacha]
MFMRRKFLRAQNVKRITHLSGGLLLVILGMNLAKWLYLRRNFRTQDDIWVSKQTLFSYPRISDSIRIACSQFRLPLWGEVFQSYRKSFPRKHPDCSEFRSWISILGDKVVILNSVGDQVTCNFSEILRMEEGYYIMLPVVMSNSSYSLRFTDVLQVKCRNSSSQKEWAEVIYAARKNPAIVTTSTNRTPDFTETLRQEHKLPPKVELNVLVWMFDGISSSFFLRNVPKAASYLTNSTDGVLFRNFNTVGRNSLPNMIPFWTEHSCAIARLTHPFVDTGMNHAEWLEPTKAKTLHVDDLPPLLISDYLRSGYVTAFYEDFQVIDAYDSIFNDPGKYWMIRNFRKPPAHYYSRPFMCNRFKLFKKPSPKCIGNLRSSTHAQNLAQSWWKQHEQENKFFFFNQMTYTHGSLTELNMIDTELEGFFESWMNSDQVRNNTIVIIMSDHGNHVLRNETVLEGMLDQRLPWVFMLVPPWFDSKFPEQMKALRSNAHDRLVTLYDVHATLKHALKGIDETYIRRWPGYSLFTTVPMNRTCRTAGIPANYCGCLREIDKGVPFDTIRNVTEQSIRQLNEHVLTKFMKAEKKKATTTANPISFPCTNWTLHAIQHYKVVKTQGSENTTGTDDIAFYLISFLANPDNVGFKVIIENDVTNSLLRLVVDSIQMTKNEGLGYCIRGKHPTLAKYCCCRQ